MAMKAIMAASLSTSRFRAMKGEVTPVPVEKIFAPARQRPINPTTVADLVESFEDIGLLEPIGVKYGGPEGYMFTLVFGAHRLEAWRGLLAQAAATGDPGKIGRWSHIPVIAYPATLPAELAESLEIQENLLREDLTTEQRQRYTMRLVELRRKEREAEAAQSGQEKNKNPTPTKKKKKGQACRP